MKSAGILSVLITSTSATAIRRQDSNAGKCCFALASAGIINDTVEENHVGDLSLGGSFQQGGFCLDQSTNSLHDSLNNNCFMRGPTFQFECVPGVVAPPKFSLSHPNANGNRHLTYGDGTRDFLACPVGEGIDKRHDIFSNSKPDKDGCVQVALSLKSESAACSGPNASPNKPTSPSQRSVLQGPTRSMPASTTIPQSARYNSTSSRTSSASQSASATTSARPTAACSVSPSAPSLAPIAVSRDGPEGSETSPDAWISPGNNTLLEYTIPPDWASTRGYGSSQLCALQFRMPWCADLPDGYPCYRFSGSEQEILAGSGMNIGLINDNGNSITSWPNDTLHQVFPGKSSVLGTFECGNVAGTHGGDRSMTWLVTSVKDFELDFRHAGVGGEEAEYQDGVGAWIVQCQ